jgi:heme exporter protein D
MQWNSASEFFAMGGYGLYVWGSFGVTALAFVAEVWLIRRRRAAAVQAIRDDLQDRATGTQ